MQPFVLTDAAQHHPLQHSMYMLAKHVLKGYSSGLQTQAQHCDDVVAAAYQIEECCGLAAGEDPEEHCYSLTDAL